MNNSWGYDDPNDGTAIEMASISLQLQTQMEETIREELKQSNLKCFLVHILQIILLH